MFVKNTIIFDSPSIWSCFVPR